MDVDPLDPEVAGAAEEHLETLAIRCLASIRDEDAGRRDREVHRFQRTIVAHARRRLDPNDGDAGTAELEALAELVAATRAMVLTSSLDGQACGHVAEQVCALTHLYVRACLLSAEPG